MLILADLKKVATARSRVSLKIGTQAASRWKDLDLYFSLYKPKRVYTPSVKRADPSPLFPALVMLPQHVGKFSASFFSFGFWSDLSGLKMEPRFANPPNPTKIKEKQKARKFLRSGRAT